MTASSILRRALPALALLALVVSLAGCFPPGFGATAGQQRIAPQISQASYSPDGSRIVFISTVTGDAQIYVANADGSNPKQLTSGSINAQPAWSPDGSKIIFSSNRGKKNPQEFDLYTMNPDGTEQTRLPVDLSAAQK